ncbi:MAG: xanthine phosphoribosyltransferase [Candidatus Limiplasma sp.]|nr:xanthine phosphoribosyltransferase [Candidatus Limiplasma sp.]MEA5145150.1 xanthine phosphoribosyltransferase [Candidatus Limiplasma sp.]
MKELRDAILEQGFGIGHDIVKVDMFLNHRLDIALLNHIGQAFHEAFADEQVDMILTIEASGIAAAITTAQAFGDLPVIFAKKSKTTSTMNNDVYEAKVYSFTHKTENYIRIAKSYLPSGVNVLIIDDFLANGEAAEGLAELVRQAGAHVAGIGVCIEKGFQAGGQKLRNEGYKVVSLATVTGIENGKLMLAGGEAQA